MKKILVPTDFSQLADTAMSIAVEISHKTKAEIEILHVIDAPHESDFSATGDTLPSGSMNDLFVLKSIEVAKKNIQKILDDVRFVGTRFHPKIKTGNPAKHLSDIIVKEKIDLVVMGTEGTTGMFKGIFNSSKTEEVVMHSECMVLSVKQKSNHFKIRNVIFATNFKDDSPEFIKNLKTLQEVFDFKIHLLYVNATLNHTDKIDEIKKEKDAFIKKFKLENLEFHVLEDFTEYTEITDYAEKINADIIALTTHQKKGLWNWLGGLSEDLVNFAETPILTYKADQK